MAIKPEGAVSAHVTDATKIVCPHCGGVEIMLSNLMDDPIDIDDDTYKALMIESDNPVMGLVGLCAQCGQEWIPMWYTLDIVATDGTDMTMTAFNTDRDPGSGANAVEDLLAGCYMIYVGDDVNNRMAYVTIATNTAADPAVITPQAHHADQDGVWIITNVLPLGLTAV